MHVHAYRVNKLDKLCSKVEVSLYKPLELCSNVEVSLYKPLVLSSKSKIKFTT